MPQRKAQKAVTLLLDSSAILNNFGFEFAQGVSYFMVPEGVREIRDLRSRGLVENAFSTRLLRVGEPSKKAMQRAGEKARALGTRLSRADLSIVALALDFRAKKKPFEAVSDDYSVQNLLKALKLPFSGVIHGEISEVKRFRKPMKKPKDRP